MKKLFLKTAVLSALAALMMSATVSASSGYGVVNVSTDSLRVRSEPSTTASTLTYLINGTRVQVHETLDNWYKISYGSYTGYVCADYLQYTPTEQSSENAVEENSATETTVVATEAVVSAAATEEKTAQITGSDVNFRSGPSTDAAVITKFNEGDTVTLLGTEENWCNVVWNGQAGYVSADYVAVDGLALVDPRGIVAGDCVNVRSAPNTDSSILTKLYSGTVVDLTALENDWYSIEYNGVTGYIRSDYIRLYKDGGNSSAASALGSKVVEAAMGYLGTPYVYGGASSRGFDCSGFTMYVYSLFGYSLPHSATSQWNSSGTYVERSNLQPGDLVMFCDPARSNGKACSHVGIYIGNGQFIHASSGSSGKYVRISSLSESYYNSYYKGAKRLG